MVSEQTQQRGLAWATPIASIVSALIGGAATVAVPVIAAYLQPKHDAAPPQSFVEAICRGVRLILDDRQLARDRPAPCPSVPPASSIVQLAPQAACSPPSVPFSGWETSALRATGSVASLNGDGKNASVAVRLENKTDSEVLFAHDTEVIAVVTNTGETVGNSGGCSLSGVRTIQVANLPKEIDPLAFSAIAPRSAITLNLGCFLVLRTPSNVSSLGATIPLVQLVNGQLKRFTVDVAGIPVAK